MNYIQYIPIPQPADLTTVQAKRGFFHARWVFTVSCVRAFGNEYAGMLLVTGSQAFLSLVNVAVKMLNGIDPPVDTLQVIVVRMVITYVCSITYMLVRGVNDPWIGPKGVRLLLWFRGFSGFFGLFGIYFSLKYLSLSDATVLTFLAPFFTGIAGALFLKEKYSYKEALAGLCSLFGVVLIARPSFLFGILAHEPDVTAMDIVPPLDDIELIPVSPEDRLKAVGVALIGVLGATGAYTTMRAIGTRAHPLHSLASFSMQSVVVASVGMIVKRVPVVFPTRLSWGLLLLEIGTFGFLAQVLLTMGLQRETAGRGVMAVYTQIIFASLWERIFFHTAPSGLSVVGTIIIIASALYVAFTKKKASPKQEDISLEEGLLAKYDEPHDASIATDRKSVDGYESEEVESGPSTPTELR